MICSAEKFHVAWMVSAKTITLRMTRNNTSSIGLVSQQSGSSIQQGGRTGCPASGVEFNCLTIIPETNSKST